MDRTVTHRMRIAARGGPAHLGHRGNPDDPHYRHDLVRVGCECGFASITWSSTETQSWNELRGTRYADHLENIIERITAAAAPLVEAWEGTE